MIEELPNSVYALLMVSLIVLIIAMFPFCMWLDWKYINGWRYSDVLNNPKLETRNTFKDGCQFKVGDSWEWCRNYKNISDE